MKTDRHELFRELTPPAGGAARMRARLANEVSNAAQARASNLPRTGWQFAVAGVAALAVIAVLVGIALRPGPSEVPRGGELYASADLDRLLGRPSAPFELSVSLGDERLALTEIPTRDPQVRIVRIGESSAN
jgi:hypothetical protein